MAEYCAVRRYVYVWEVPIRIAHWGIFFSIIVLSFTGIYIHHPFINVAGIEQPYLMGWMRTIHYITGAIFMFFVLLRIYWFIISGRYGSLKSFVSSIDKKHFKIFLDYVKYYAFLKKDPPHVIGHNPLAIVAYFILYILFIFQIITGFALWGLYDQNGLSYELFGWVFSVVNIQWIRFYHFILMFFIAGFFINHIYSAVLFDFRTQSGEISAIFAGWKPLRNESNNKD
ncbi:MAG: Ni/Fe-hydrogenase, b-type cytochrome subunit [Deferribacterota bacterium]|nr:Ni/Fe-hydrogenase, b-type cytochrome subunit [Deferribacterota bacterium]